MPPRRKQSLVWKYFHVSSYDENKAICNLCNLALSRGGGEKKNYGTSCLLKHLKNSHRREIDPVELDQGSLVGNTNQMEQNITLHDEPRTRKFNKIKEAYRPMEKPMVPESYKLRHNDHLSLILEFLAKDECSMDVTMAAQGKVIKAHKAVLSAVSPFFQTVLKENPCQHPIIIMPRDISYEELKSIIEYVYKGEIMVSTDELASFLKTAEVLQMKGLSPSLDVNSSSCKYIGPFQGLPLEVDNDSSEDTCNPSHLTFKTPSTVALKGEAARNEKSKQTGINNELQEKLNPLDFLESSMMYIKEEIGCQDEDIEEYPHNADASDPILTEPPSDHGSSLSEYLTLLKNSSKKDKLKDNSDLSVLNDLDISPSSYPSYVQNANSTQKSDRTFKPGDILKASSKDSYLHSAASPFVCPHCFESHRPIEELKRHLHLKHPTKPSFTCNCGKVFTKHILLTEHKRTCDL